MKKVESPSFSSLARSVGPEGYDETAERPCPI